jgi:hypothetical protein
MPGIWHTINMGNKHYYGLKNILWTSEFQKDTKRKNIQSPNYTILLYECESWTLTKDVKGELHIFERF